MKKTLAVLAAAVTFGAPSTLAHHSFTMFDTANEVEMKGTVAGWQWISPHTWLYVLVPGKDGKPEKWSLEGSSTGAMESRGFAKDSFTAGESVTVYFFPLRNGAKGGALNQVVLANGKAVGKRQEALKYAPKETAK